jgi:arginase
MSKSLALIGYASGLGANNAGCGDGPIQLKAQAIESFLARKGIQSYWQAMLLAKEGALQNDLAKIAELNTHLAELTAQLTQQKHSFIVFGGDHSSAIGTWSGASHGKDSIGLIWIDAHMDSHTFDTTQSGNIHGMPLAVLLGYGDRALTHIVSGQAKLKPEHTSLIGVRSFEAGEKKLLHRLGVSIYGMQDIKAKGLKAVLQEAIARAKKNTVGFGISLDLDAIDPRDAPGVGVPEANGIRGKDLCLALALLQNELQLIGLEIAEYNPHLDEFHKTESLIQKIIVSIFGD